MGATLKSADPIQGAAVPLSAGRAPGPGVPGVASLAVAAERRRGEGWTAQRWERHEIE